MPYEITFAKRVEASDPEEYINECCWGGDVVSDVLLPEIEKNYQEVRAEQEDWGWFIWFRSGDLRLAVDIFCDDPGQGRFRVHLNATRKRFLRSEVEDRPELERLRELVAARLTEWVGEAPRAAHFRE